MSIRLLIADDHKLMREGLRALLSGESDIEVIGEASDGRAIVKMVEDSSPDIMLMDISMPQLNGIDATRQIEDLAGDTRVIALSMHADRLFVQGVLKAGAAGYILKDSAFDELAQAVRAVSNEQKRPNETGVSQVAGRREVAQIPLLCCSNRQWWRKCVKNQPDTPWMEAFCGVSVRVSQFGYFAIVHNRRTLCLELILVRSPKVSGCSLVASLI